MVSEGRRRCAPEQPRQPQLGRRGVQQVARRGRRPRRPGEGRRRRRTGHRYGGRAGRGSRDRRSPRRPRPEQGPTSASIQASWPAPSAARRTGPSRPRSRQPPGQPMPAPRPAVLGGPGAERGPGAGAAVEPALLPKRGERAGVGGLRPRRRSGVTGPASGDEAEPREVLARSPRRTRAGSAGGRGPRCAAGPGRRWPAPRPTSTARWRRDRGAGSPSGPGRTGSAPRVAAPRGQPRPSSPLPGWSRRGRPTTATRRARGVARAAARSAGARSVLAGMPRAVARLERSRRAEQPPVERQQVGLGQRPLVGHRHAQQDLALALGVADGAPARRRPWPRRPRGRATPAR